MGSNYSRCYRLHPQRATGNAFQDARRFYQVRTLDEMYPRPAFAAIILSGGKSTRMGSAKSELLLDGQTLLQRTVRILATVAEQVVIVGAANSPAPTFTEESRKLPKLEFVCDSQPDRGPLEGLASGLRAISNRCQQAFVCGCDSPLLSSAFALRMLQLLGEYDAAAARINGQLHPLAAAYRVSILPRIAARLAAEQRSLHGLLEAINTRYVQSHELTDVDAHLDSLRNINLPSDWQKLLSEIQARDQAQQ